MSGESSPSTPSSRTPSLATVLEQLACPACLAGLRLSATELVCHGCGRHYPIVDGIPVLIAEQAGTSVSENASGT